MLKNNLFFVALLAAQCLSGCSSLAFDETDVSHLPAQALYVQGEMAMAKHSMSEATQYLEALDVRFPFSPYMQQAQLGLIYAYYDLEQYDNALDVANAYLGLHAHDKQASYVHYMRGLIQFERDQSWFRQLIHREPGLHDLAHLRKAYDDFIVVTKQYPDSAYAADAIRRTIYIRNQLAESELLAAKYYFRKHAYLAALNRLDYLAENFPGAPQGQKALCLKHQAAAQLALKKT